MPASKKKQDYNNQYVKDNYSRIAVFVPKEWRPELETMAKSQGLSLNAYIKQAIAAKMAEDVQRIKGENTPENTD